VTTLDPVTWSVTQAQIDAYAAAAGANDPIHVDPVGRAASGGTIAQGMLVLAMMAEFVAAGVPNGAAWRERGALDVRFRAPARPGDRLTVRAERDGGADAGDGHLAFALWCENDAGVRIVAGVAHIPPDAFAS